MNFDFALKLALHFGNARRVLGQVLPQISPHIAKKQILLEIAALNLQQKKQLSEDLDKFISNAFEQYGDKIDDKLKQLYKDLKKSDNLELKLKVGLPLSCLTGIDLGIEGKIDVKKWMTKMYGIHKMEAFKVGYQRGK